MRRDKITQLGPRCPVSLAGALDRVADDMPGDEGKDNGMPPHGGLPILRD